MTEKQKYYLWFALIISICMTILMEIFQLYTLPVLCILELFMLVNVCMIIVNLFIRKCVNHVETLIVTGCFFLFLLERNTFMLLAFRIHNNPNLLFPSSLVTGCGC